MTRYLLDTNHASGVFKGQLSLRDHPKAVSDAEFGIATPAVGELWFMVFNSTRVRKNVADLNRALTRLKIWQYDDIAAIEFGRIRTDARRSGRNVADIDTQIAAVARANDLILLTDDSDFNSIAGLKTENWLR